MAAPAIQTAVFGFDISAARKPAAPPGANAVLGGGADGVGCGEAANASEGDRASMAANKYAVPDFTDI